MAVDVLTHTMMLPVQAEQAKMPAVGRAPGRFQPNSLELALRELRGIEARRHAGAGLRTGPPLRR